jgi:hypothetical protein
MRALVSFGFILLGNFAIAAKSCQTTLITVSEQKAFRAPVLQRLKNPTYRVLSKFIEINKQPHVISAVEHDNGDKKDIRLFNLSSKNPVAKADSNLYKAGAFYAVGNILVANDQSFFVVKSSGVRPVVFSTDLNSQTLKSRSRRDIVDVKILPDSKTLLLINDLGYIEVWKKESTGFVQAVSTRLVFSFYKYILGEKKYVKSIYGFRTGCFYTPRFFFL